MNQNPAAFLTAPDPEPDWMTWLNAEVVRYRQHYALVDDWCKQTLRRMGH